MKLITNKAVTYNSGISSQTQGIVEGSLSNCIQDFNINNYSFSYRYVAEDGYLIKQSNFTITKEQVNVMYEAVKALLPTDLSYFELTEYLYYLAFRMEMANTFNCQVTDIDIVL